MILNKNVKNFFRSLFSLKKSGAVCKTFHIFSTCLSKGSTYNKLYLSHSKENFTFNLYGIINMNFLFLDRYKKLSHSHNISYSDTSRYF